MLFEYNETFAEAFVFQTTFRQRGGCRTLYIIMSKNSNSDFMVSYKRYVTVVVLLLYMLIEHVLVIN